MELREQILEAAITIFNEKGMKFTMDNLATRMGMSKKTIYTVFSDKESLCYEMVDYLFDKIKVEEQKIIDNSVYDTKEKLERVLGVLPESYRNIDFGQLYMLRDKYPAVYSKLEERLENGWEGTITLLKQGMQEGVIRKVPIPIVKMMFEASLEQFFRRDILIRNGLSYQEALTYVVEILMMGIEV